MSVLRRLYNVAYGKVRSWQQDDPVLSEMGKAETGTYAASGAGEAVERLRERLGHLQAEAELGRKPPGRMSLGRREEDEEEPARPEPSETPETPAQPAGPRQRTL